MAAPTNASKIEKLQALGIELTGEENGKDLDALLAIHAPKTDKEDEGDKPEEETKESAVDHGDTTDSVTVEYNNPHTGRSQRIFSREIHGNKFKEVARLFMEKHNGSIVE